MKNTKKKNIKIKSILMALTMSLTFALKCSLEIQNIDINVNIINQNIIEKN